MPRNGRQGAARINFHLDILVLRNHKSGKLEISVPVLGNHLFVLDELCISSGILVKTLLHLRCVAVFTNIPEEIIIGYAQKRI